MTFKKPKRAGLVALIFGVLLGLALMPSLPTPTQAPATPRSGTGGRGRCRAGS